VWGIGSNQVSLLLGNNSQQALFVVVTLWVVGCWLELRGWFCFVVSSFGCLLEKRKKMQAGGG